MKNKKPYLPVAVMVGVVAVLLLASFPPRWIAEAQDATPPGQQPTTGPQPDVGETVLVPKKNTPPAPTQPTADKPAPSQRGQGRKNQSQ